MEPVRPIKINLLRAEQQADRNQLIPMISMVLIIAILGVMGGLYAISLGQLHAQNALNETLKARLTSNQKSSYSYQTQVVAYEGIQNRESMVRTMEQKRASYLDLMTEVEQAVPRGIILNNLDIQTSNIAISGTADNEEQIATMLAGLRESPWLKNLQSISVIGNGQEANGFLRFDIQYGREVQQK